MQRGRKIIHTLTIHAHTHFHPYAFYFSTSAQRRNGEKITKKKSEITLNQ